MKRDHDKGEKKEKIPVAWQVVILLLASAALGISVNHVRPDAMPLVGEWMPEARITSDSGESMVISLEEAERLFSSDRAIFLDARSSGPYSEGHIKGAKNLPWQSFEEFVDKVIPDIPPDALIVTYCDGEECSLSEDLAKELSLMGYKKVRVLVNGWTRWVEAGLPMEKGHEGHSDGRKG